MKKILLLISISFYSLIALSQTGRRVLVEEFSETGCGACAEYDSAFQVMTNANADKISVINYHCFYMLDTFFTKLREKRARSAQAELEKDQSADLEQVSYVDNEDFNSWLDESYPYEGKLSYSFALFSLYYEDYLVRLEEFRDSAEEEDE